MSAAWVTFATTPVDEPPPHPQPIPGDTRMFDVPTVPVPPPEPLIVKGSVTVRIDWEADVAALARHYDREYAAHPPSWGRYTHDDQGSSFLHDLVVEATEAYLAGDAHGLTVASDGDPDVDFRWTPALQADLDRRLS